MVAEGGLDAEAGESLCEEGIYACLGCEVSGTSCDGLGVETGEELEAGGQMGAGALVVTSEELEVDEDEAGDQCDSEGVLAEEMVLGL